MDWGLQCSSVRLGLLVAVLLFSLIRTGLASSVLNAALLAQTLIQVLYPLGSARFMVALDDLKGRFQPKQLCDNREREHRQLNAL